MIKTIRSIAGTFANLQGKRFISSSSAPKKGLSSLNARVSQEQPLFSQNQNYSLASHLLSYKRVTSPNMTQYSEYISVACNHLNKADTKMAAQYFEKAYKLSLKLFGEKSKNTAICLSYLAQTFQVENNNDQSLAFYTESLEILKHRNAFCPVLASDIHHNISTIYQLDGDLPKALDHSQTSLEILMEYSPEEHKRFSLILQSLGKIYFLMGDLMESKDFFKRALEILSQDPKDNAMERSLLYDKIGALMEKEGNLEEAINFKKMSLEIHERDSIEGDDSVLFNKFLSLAALYEKSTNYKDSLKFLEKAFNLCKNKKSKQNIHQGPLLVRIGEIHLRLGNTLKGIKALEDALKIIDKNSLGGNAMHKRARRLLSQATQQKQAQEKSFELDRRNTEKSIVMDSSLPSGVEEAEMYKNVGLEYLEKSDIENARFYLIKAMQGFSFWEGPDCKSCKDLKKILQNL